MVRRSLAAGAGLLVVLLLVLGVRGCLDARSERSIKDYVRDVTALSGESNQLREALFALLTDSGQAGDVDIENALNSYRGESERLVERVRDLDTPGEMDQAQRFLVQAFEFRRDGVIQIADALPAAIVESGDRAGGTEAIAFAMQKFLASDQIYALRAAPAINTALEQNDLTGEDEAPQTAWIDEVDWLLEETVANRVAALGGAGGGGADGEAAPGLHGNGLGTVTLGGQTLVPGGSASVSVAEDLVFSVGVANQGENTETDVQVTVTVGSGGAAIEASEVLDTIAAGEEVPVEIPLGESPPTGQNVPVTIEVAPVPGEEKTDNNAEEFSVVFTS